MLDAKQRQTLQALSSPQILHGAVERSFSVKEKRKLWRIDWLNDSCYLLVLSEERPDFTHIAYQFGYPSSEHPWDTKDYNTLLSRLKDNQEWHFRLRANPTRSSIQNKDDASGRGKVYAHVTQEQQRQWLLMKAESCGFMLHEDDFNVVHTQWFKFHKEGNCKVTLRTAAFEGNLTISDTECFKQTLLSGVGRAKAYGCGLLTIAHCRSYLHE